MTNSEILTLVNGLVGKMERRSGTLRRDISIIADAIDDRNSEIKLYKDTLIRFGVSSYNDLPDDETKSKFVQVAGSSTIPTSIPNSTLSVFKTNKTTVLNKMLKQGY